MGLHFDDDIPQAVREALPPPEPRQRPIALWLGLGLGSGAIALLLGLWSLNRPRPPLSVPPPAPKSLLGHHAYTEAPQEALQSLTADGQIRLRRSAAQSFLAMQAAAKQDGITLIPLSGYRSRRDQEQLFFGIKAQRNESVSQRADVSAPPGYSEHHTGYAIDIGDGSQPKTNVDPLFEQTSAFYWLKKHAQRYNFELSFSKGNSQGVSYEPWHWRFVGDSDSLKTFYQK
jgi:D-alanyl-D-alanine carboxypeptidase